ncbi:MAG: hypothetical protein WKF96_01590 [Solirubrobacteraceae bacterium]
MDDPQPPERPIAEVRATAADLHHRWKQAKATGDAEALSRVYALAKEAGVPADQLEQITGGFVTIAQELIGKEGRKRRRNPFRWPRRKRVDTSDPPAIPPGEQRRELPSGD